MPNYDYEEFDRKQAEWEANNQNHPEGQEGHEGRESSGDSDEIAW